MYIYNITFHVSKDIEQDWLKYVKQNFIPKMLKSGLLESSLTSKVVTEDNQGTSYSIQFKTKDKKTLDKFIEKELEPIINEINQKFAPKMVYFATELDVINTDE
jgi:hypothetical protein